MIPSVCFLWVQIVDMDFDMVLGTIGKKTYEYLCFFTVSGTVLDMFFNGVGYVF
jgi:hypothetical protein